MSGKKWASFEEMYDDLKNTNSYKNLPKTSTEQLIQGLVKKIESAATSKDFFDYTCELSSLFDNLDQNSTHEIYKKTNVYVLVLNSVLRNKKFIETLIELVSKNKSISSLKEDGKSFEGLIFLNTAIRLAFFGIAIDHQSIDRNSIGFLRKNTTDLLRYIFKRITLPNSSFINLCYFLEKVAWDHDLYFNQNHKASFPVKLNDTFLFSNLKASRSFAGITFLSLIIRPVIENSFKKIIITMEDESFSLSKGLDSIYQTSKQLKDGIDHYYRNSLKDITAFFDIFIQNNERNLLFFFEKMCAGFHFQEEKKYFNIILEKVKLASIIKKDLSVYAREHLSAFNGAIQGDDNEWTNKIFIVSIRTLSVLEEVERAHDSSWVKKVGVHELRQWLIDIHEILNKYYIEDDWDKIKDFVHQENENIEWKSSFYTPLEQEFVDEESDAPVKKRIFEKILKVILAMINTNGGVLIVGIVENHDAVVRVQVKESLIKKNGLTFFDIGYEFKTQNKTLDSVRLQILDNLKQITDSTADKFNGLIEFEPLILRNDNQVVSVIKIIIKKSEKPFFNVKKENNAVWISLTKRAQGQNIDVDVRESV